MRHDLDRARESNIKVIQDELRTSQNEQHTRAHVQKTILGQIHKDLTHILAKTKEIPAQGTVLDLLWFESITTRQQSVDSAHKATFRWLLYETGSSQSSSGDETDRSEHDSGDEINYGESNSGDETDDSDSGRRLEQEALKRREKRDAFLSWLRVGSGVFFISGKAGSGKSTLMKFLSQEEKTREELQAWARSDGKQLILARFFFWNSGDKLQKSLEGLYRAILWDILRQFPDLIPYAFPDIWSSASSEKGYMHIRHHPSFDLEDLHAALDRTFTSQLTINRYRLCLFIDGLDEFDGLERAGWDYWKLSKAISSWSTDNVKVCISSRQYNEFMTIFASDPSRHLQLHDLTRQDMFKFVRSEFRNDDRSAAIRAERYQYSNLIDAIVARSEGIFLWVVLVTSEMLKDMGNCCSLMQFRQKLDNIPQGLSNIFKRMFDDIDRPERQRAARMPLVMRLGNEITASRWLCTHIMMDGITDVPSNLNSILSGELEPRTRTINWESACRTTAPRLIARGNGLVEMMPTTSEKHGIHDHILQFVHRSVKDYLDEEKVYAQLLELAGSFCPWKTMLHSLLAILKFYDLGSNTTVVISNIIYIHNQAELIGPSHFTKEMDCFIQMCRNLADANRGHDLDFRYPHQGWLSGRAYVYQICVSDVFPTIDDVESAMTSLAISFGSINFALQQVARSPALMAPTTWGSNVLLAAAMIDLRKSQPQRDQARKVDAIRARDDPTKLIIHRLLNIDDSFANAVSLPFFQGIRDSHYLPNPSWTTWTSFLFVLSWFFSPNEITNKISDHDAFKAISLNLIETFLDHGGDPAVCFIAFDEDTIPRTPGDTDRLKEIETKDAVFYVTLPAMMEHWGLPLPSKTLQLLNTHARGPITRWGLAKYLSLLGTTESRQLDIRQLDAQKLLLGKFVTLKVVTMSQLQNVEDRNLREAIDSQAFRHNKVKIRA